MAISMYDASVPVFVRSLDALAGSLAKAKTHFAAKQVDPTVVLGVRLIVDMLPFTFQVRTACNFANNTTARLAGLALPAFDNDDATIDDLMRRIERTLAFVKTADRVAIDAAGEREIEFPVGGTPMRLRGDDYLVHFAMPNFHFHATMAYAILRQAGVDLGKRDFLGKVPGFEALMAA